PIWNTVQRYGQRSATMFWVGSDVAIGGRYPTYWHSYADSWEPSRKVRQIFDWFELPRDKRPTLLTLYFGEVDSSGHQYGPTSPEVKASVKQIDAALTDLYKGLEERGIANSVNIIIVSDHGMTDISNNQTI